MLKCTRPFFQFWPWLQKPLARAVLFFSLVILIFAGYSYQNNQVELNNYLDLVKQQQRHKYENTKLSLSSLASLTYETLVFNNQVVALLAKAANADAATPGGEQARTEARKGLYNLLYPKYQLLKRHHVRQLHFHLPGAISFLRFHRPDKFGDSLLGVRPSLATLNQTKKPVSGFEEGRIFNGFRHIFPLFYQNQFVGSVEVSYGFDGISQMLSRPGKVAESFILSKGYVVNRVMKFEQLNYAESDFGPQWLMDKQAAKAANALATLSLETQARINQKIRSEFLNKVSKKIDGCSDCVLPVKDKGIYYTATFLSLKNFEQDNVGFLVMYEEDHVLPLVQANFRQQFLILLGIAFLLSLGVYYYGREHQKHLSHMIQLATHDALTGLYNRFEIQESLPEMVAEHHQNKAPLSVIFFDIDHFKIFNDTYGHLVGDAVLQGVSDLVSKRIRAADVFVRWGGEEFLIIMPNTKEDGAGLVAEILRSSIEAHLFTAQKLKVTGSFGVTQLEPEEIADELLNRADVLLYKAKESGRNCVVQS